MNDPVSWIPPPCCSGQKSNGEIIGFRVLLEKIGCNSAPAAPPELSLGLSILIFCAESGSGHEKWRKVHRKANMVEFPTCKTEFDSVSARPGSRNLCFESKKSELESKKVESDSRKTVLKSKTIVGKIQEVYRFDELVVMKTCRFCLHWLLEHLEFQDPRILVLN